MEKKSLKEICEFQKQYEAMRRKYPGIVNIDDYIHLTYETFMNLFGDMEIHIRKLKIDGILWNRYKTEFEGVEFFALRRVRREDE